MRNLQMKILMVLGCSALPGLAEDGKMLEQFDGAKQELQWQTVNDGVMG